MKSWSFLLLLLVLVGACTSGRKAFERGHYDEATYKAINRLRSSPNNAKAQATLRDAYSHAVAWHESQIAAATQSNNAFRWEGIADTYTRLNDLHAQISTCPNCLQVVGQPVRYTAALEQARQQAAEARYLAGKQALEQKEDKMMARQAFNHFAVADRYFPGFRDIRDLQEDAKWYATLKIVVDHIPVQSRVLSVSGEFFEHKIQEYLRQMPVNPFVRFFTVEEAQAYNLQQPDQLLQLSFDEFAVGQVYLKEKEKEVSRDSVEVGKVKVGEKEQAVYGTVKAKLRQFEKNVVSSGVLDLRIIDPVTQAVLSQEKLPGSFTWVTQWATFSGDERALTKEEVQLAKLREVPPPPPQDLFVAFTQPIYGQITQKIKDFYRRY